MTYTSGVWLVKPGNEQQFIDAWGEMATWTTGAFPGAISAVLLRDETNSRRFISFGPWQSPDDITAWRESDGFRERVGRIREMLENFEPGTYTPVFKVGE